MVLDYEPHLAWDQARVAVEKDMVSGFSFPPKWNLCSEAKRRERTQSVSTIAIAQNAKLDIIVESRVFAETGRVGHGTLGVIEVVLEACDLEDAVVSLWSFTYWVILWA